MKNARWAAALDSLESEKTAADAAKEDALDSFMGSGLAACRIEGGQRLEGGEEGAHEVHSSSASSADSLDQFMEFPRRDA